MALTKCEKRGKEVSMKADKCHDCGAPVKKKGIGCLRGIIIVVCVAAFASCLASSSTAKDKERVDGQKDVAEVSLNTVAEAVQKGSEGWEAEAAQRRAEAEALSAENEKEKAEFLGSIQNHYKQLTTYYKRKEFDQAAEVLNLFVLYDKLDYKDVDRILRKVIIWNIEKDLPSVPATDIERNIGLYTQLSDLDPTNQKYKRKLKYYAAKAKQKEREAYEKANPPFIRGKNLELFDEITINEFTVRMYEDRYDIDASFVILRRGTIIYRKNCWNCYIGGRHEYYKSLPSPGTDITGNGKPNLVLIDWSGGMHCCYTAYIFEFGSRVKILARIEGEHNAPWFSDLDGDSIPEVIVRDWTFEYWPFSFADSPAPEVVLRWKNGKYVVDAQLMEIPAPSLQDLAEQAESIRTEMGWDDECQGDREACIRAIPQRLFQTALDLMYGGHEELGRRFIEMAGKSKYPFDSKLLAELNAQLSKSPYWSIIKSQREAKKKTQRNGFSVPH